MWLNLTVVGKSQQNKQQVAVTIEVGILQKHILVSSLYMARMMLS